MSQPNCAPNGLAGALAIGMTQRVLALVGFVFYGALDRFTGMFFHDLSYPADDDPLASRR